MGFNSVVLICNDAWNEIDQDPAGWWAETKEQLSRATAGDNPQTYGFGSHGGAFVAVTCVHADVTTLIAVGQNRATPIYATSTELHHSKPEDQVRLLKEAAAQLGHQVVRLPITKLLRLAAQQAALAATAGMRASYARRAAYLKELVAETKKERKR